MYKYNLNDVEWGEFFISDLFLFNERGKRLKIEDRKPGKIPFVTAGESNNGISAFINNVQNKEYSNAITIDMFGNAFFHKETFKCDDNITVLQNKTFTTNIYLFLTSRLNILSSKYSYGKQLRPNRLSRDKIKLPIDNEGNPNFQFMEEYIKEREQKQIETLTKYYSDKLNELNMSLITLKKSWGGVECREFYLKSLFDFYLSPGDNQAKLLDTGNIPLISSGTSENGICKFILQGDDKSKLYERGLITIDMFGKAFYHPYNFYSVSHGRINILKPKLNMTDKSKKFLVASIEKSINGLFSYNYMCSQQRLQNIKILLPIDQNNNPNWEYMDNFIEEIEKKYSKQLTGYFNTKLNGVSIFENTQNPRGGVTYKEFFIGDVFNITSTSSGIDKNKLIGGSGKIPYVTRSEIDNGINLFISDVQDSKYKKDPGNVITIGLDTQTVFYQQNTFYTGEKVQILYNKNLNKYNAMFLIPFLQLQMRKFIWEKGASLVRLNKTKILLPIDQNNEPDWQFMEEVCKNIESKKIIEIMQGLNTIHNPQAHI